MVRSALSLTRSLLTYSYLSDIAFTIFMQAGYSDCQALHMSLGFDVVQLSVRLHYQDGMAFAYTMLLLPDPDDRLDENAEGHRGVRVPVHGVLLTAGGLAAVTRRCSRCRRVSGGL